MRLTLTMTITAIGSLLFGLGYLLFPACARVWRFHLSYAAI